MTATRCQMWEDWCAELEWAAGDYYGPGRLVAGRDEPHWRAAFDAGLSAADAFLDELLRKGEGDGMPRDDSRASSWPSATGRSSGTPRPTWPG